MMNTIEQAGFDPEMALEEMIEKKGLLIEMIDKFNTLKSPDRSKTIRDRIKSIKNSSELDAFTRSINQDKDFFALGYQLAIRGEQHSIWHLVTKEEGKPEYFNKTTRLRVEDFKGFIENLLQGYASCYFQSWLESELKKKDTPVQAPKQEIAPGKSTITSIQTNPNTSFQIKWTGQRNQVYELFR